VSITQQRKTENIEIRKISDLDDLIDRWIYVGDDGTTMMMGATTANVPCNGCTSCCWHPNVDLRPDEMTSELQAILKPVWSETFRGHVIPKRADGGCIHLTPEGGCGVYEHRPLACRAFDCRMYSAVGMINQHCTKPLRGSSVN
jgi:hypothetical protein